MRYYKIVVFICYYISISFATAQVKKPDSLQLFFASAKYNITSTHKTQIEQFVKSIKLEEVRQIRIKGYTDFVGNHVYNNKLSKKRAKAVYTYITNNYTFKAIAQQGLGELESNSTDTAFEEGNSKHRKVDIILSYEPPKTVMLSLTRKQRYLNKLPKLSVGEKLRIQYTNFHISTATITKASTEDIEGIAKILKAYPNISVCIEGHVCCGDIEEYETKTPNEENLKLSKARAKSVYDQLIKRGVKPSRLSYIGYGFTRPLDYPESTIEIQKENRRVELKVVRN